VESLSLDTVTFLKSGWLAWSRFSRKVPDGTNRANHVFFQARSVFLWNVDNLSYGFFVLLRSSYHLWSASSLHLTVVFFIQIRPLVLFDCGASHGRHLDKGWHVQLNNLPPTAALQNCPLLLFYGKTFIPLFHLFSANGWIRRCVKAQIAISCGCQTAIPIVN
jgi:hypothetical protein